MCVSDDLCRFKVVIFSLAVMLKGCSDVQWKLFIRLKNEYPYQLRAWRGTDGSSAIFETADKKTLISPRVYLNLL